MEVTRRSWLAGLGALPIAAKATALAGKPGTAPTALPDRSSFRAQGMAYLDSGTVHPVSIGAQAAVSSYFAERADPASGRAHADSRGVLSKFARLINADEDELTFVRSTTTGEHLIVDALDLVESGAHVVTDTLHFFGSFPLYLALQERGVDVTWLRPRDGRIPLEDIERAITPRTKLVSLSLVSTFNGFEHDLKRVCDIAHANGALVYADIIHAAGCVPLDVKESGVDFAACAAYKWLMGDFGLAFIYARRESQDRLRRERFGYYGVSSFQSHVYPLDPPGETIADVEMQEGAAGLFATGTWSHAGVVHLDHSLDYILGLGVDAINAHSRSLTDRLKSELPRMGYEVITPVESRAPIVTCIRQNALELRPRLESAGVKVMVSRNRFRATPSVFNGMDDVERLLRALS